MLSATRRIAAPCSPCVTVSTICSAACSRLRTCLSHPPFTATSVSAPLLCCANLRPFCAPCCSASAAARCPHSRCTIIVHCSLPCRSQLSTGSLAVLASVAVPLSGSLRPFSLRTFWSCSCWFSVAVVPCRTRSFTFFCSLPRCSRTTAAPCTPCPCATMLMSLRMRTSFARPKMFARLMSLSTPCPVTERAVSSLDRGIGPAGSSQ